MSSLEVYVEDLLAAIQQLAEAATRIADAIERAESDAEGSE